MFINITFLHKCFYEITKRSIKSLLLHSKVRRKKMKISASSRLRSNVAKTAYTVKKGTLVFNVRQNLFFWKTQNLENVNLQKQVCHRRNCLIFL